MAKEGQAVGPLTIITASPITDRYCDSRGKYPTFKRNNCLRLQRKQETPHTHLRRCRSLPNVKTGGVSPSPTHKFCQSQWPSRDISLDDKRKTELEHLAAGILIQENCSLQRPAIVSITAPKTRKPSSDTAVDPVKNSNQHAAVAKVKVREERQVLKCEYRRRCIIESAKFAKKEVERLRLEKKAQKEDYEKRMGMAQADLERKRWERMEAWEQKCSYYRVLIQDKKTAQYSKVQEEKNRKKMRRQQP